MRGGDVDALTGWFLAAEVRHPVECLDCENVGGMGEESPDLHPALQQAVLGRPVADAVSARQARGAGRLAQGATDGVTQVRPAAGLQRLAPLQAERAVIHLGDDAAWSRGGFYGDTQAKSNQLLPSCLHSNHNSFSRNLISTHSSAPDLKTGPTSEVSSRLQPQRWSRATILHACCRI